jgi:tetratricopeptide (TPR) repeat protein
VTTDGAVAGRAGRPGHDEERWALNDQREFLLRSIADAERELDAGDLAPADYDVLRQRDEARLAEVEAELAALGPAPPLPAEPHQDPPPLSRRRFSPRRRAGIVVCCLLIAAGIGILVNHAVNPALPGQAVSGSVTITKEQQIDDELQQADILNNQKKGQAALQLYDKVLGQDPGDPRALAASGWLEWNYGVAGRSTTLMSAGRESEEQAVRVAPTYYAGHLFLGLIELNQDHNAPGAIDEFTKFLADHPPKGEIATVAKEVAAGYRLANVPFPAALAAALPTTTTTTSAP